MVVMRVLGWSCRAAFGAELTGWITTDIWNILVLTLLPVRPDTSARKDMIRPFEPFFNRTSLASSSTPAFLLSFSSSFPHSNPFCTLVQCDLWRLSSSGAPLVYVKSQRGHVLSTDVSILKWSWVRVFCFPFAVDFWGFGFLLVGVFVHDRWSTNGRLRLRAGLGGEEANSDGGEDGGNRGVRVL